MSEGIPGPALQALIQLGTAASGPDRDNLLAAVNQWEFVNRRHWNDWTIVLEPLSATDHAAVAKGLVTAEEAHRWCGGSVASAIWVYRAFERKFPDAADALAAWMLEHSTNPWVPFGSNRGSARSLEEYRGFREWRQNDKKRTEANESARSELKEAKENVRKRLTPYRERVQRAVSEARDALVQEIELLPAAACLEHLAWDEQHPLAFYPVALAERAESGWLDVASETREALLKRAAEIPRGDWRKWLKRRTTAAAGDEVPIQSRDYWFKIVDFLQPNWALTDPADAGCRVWFFGDTSGVFDQLDFPDISAAESALSRNGFSKFADDPKAATFLHKPKPPFVRRAHPNGPIYSSGRFWK